jgi:hypothetical protein
MEPKDPCCVGVTSSAMTSAALPSLKLAAGETDKIFFDDEVPAFACGSGKVVPGSFGAGKGDFSGPSENSTRLSRSRPRGPCTTCAGPATPAGTRRARSIGRCVIPISVWCSADHNVSGARWAFGTLTVYFSACEAAIFLRERAIWRVVLTSKEALRIEPINHYQFDAVILDRRFALLTHTQPPARLDATTV